MMKMTKGFAHRQIKASGLIWAQPVADVLSLIVVAVMLAVKIKRMDTENNK